MSDFESVGWPTARIAHKCEECRTTIRPGEQYARMAGVWEGDFYTDRVCCNCYALRTLYFRAMKVSRIYEEDEIVYTRGSLIEGVSDYLERRDKLVAPVSEAVAELSRLLQEDIERSLRYIRDEAVRARDARARRLYRAEQASISSRLIGGLSWSAKNGPLVPWGGLRGGRSHLSSLNF